MEEQKKKKSKKRLSFLIGLMLLILAAMVIVQIVKSFFTFEEFTPTIRNSVGLIEVNDQILNVEDQVRALHRFIDDPLIKAIVIRIETPGGLVGSSQELYSEILTMKEESEKPVIASLGNLAASGGYYIASAADVIFAHPGTVTGSIGVIFNLMNVEELVKKVGVRFEVVKSGKLKGIGSPTREMTEEEIRIIQGVLDDTYSQFVEAVLFTRKERMYNAMEYGSSVVKINALHTDSASTETLFNTYVKTVCDGRIYSGRQAHALGLVDYLGGLEDALRHAANLGGIKAARPPVVEMRKKSSIWDLVLGRAESTLNKLIAPEISLEYRLTMQ